MDKPKDLFICMTHRHELRGCGECWVGKGGAGQRGIKGRKMGQL